MEVRQDRTPTRASRDRRGGTSFKNGRLARPNSPARGALHRRHSPPKEKRREYVCKVYLPNLVALERDYLSTDRRYSRLCVSAEFTKVIINWPSNELKLSLNNPVSFEHDFSEEPTTEVKDQTFVSSSQAAMPLEIRNTVYNAKVILLSGTLNNFTEDPSSEMSSNDRVSHICSLLKFAVMKKENALMAIGGSWVPSDGGDPSFDESSLIQSAIRHAKDIADVDLRKCRDWNAFLQIHYDRFGDDGFFSHKEVTVLFVPDLSECLPSYDTWKEQFAAHKTTVMERQKKNAQKEKLSSNGEQVEKSGEAGDSAQTTILPQNGKKKIIRRIVKLKVSDNQAETSTGDDNENIVSDVQPVENAEGGSKTTVKKKIVKRLVKRKVPNNQPCGEPKEDAKNTVPEPSGQTVEESSQMGDDKNADSVSVSQSLDTDEQITSPNDEGADVVTEKENNAEELPTCSPLSVHENDARVNIKHDDSSDHAGLILRTSGVKSVSVTLESLLEYTEKDTDESTFELSLFAEAFYEMLQYQMGTRIFNFLQKVRVAFVTKRNERKRQKDDADATQSSKRLKTTDDASNKSDEANACPATVPDDVASHPKSDEEKDECNDDADQESAQREQSDEAAENWTTINEKPQSDEENEALGSEIADDDKNEAAFFDDDLLLAFRFFDRNQAGYIRAEDMKQIIHSLGKCLCHREVKELVQSALFESNTGRDDRILYDNLLRMTF